MNIRHECPMPDLSFTVTAPLHLRMQDGETITTDQGWTVHPDTTPTGGLAITSTASTPTTTTAFLSGGQAGDTYLLCSTIQTSGGRTVRRSLTVRIANL